MLVLILLYPFQSTVVPAWRLQVVDEGGKPLADMSVNYYWQHYGIEWWGDEVRTRTDANGYVSFPERKTRASLVQRAARLFTNVISYPHSSFERDGHIVVGDWRGNYETASASYDGEGDLPTQVALKPPKPPSPPPTSIEEKWDFSR